MNTSTMPTKEKPVVSSQGRPTKNVLQEHVDKRRDQYGCGLHPEIYDWIHGAKTQTVGNKPIMVTGNGNFPGEKLRAFAKDTESRARFEQAFGGDITITDDGTKITLHMTFQTNRERRGIGNLAASAAAA